MGKVTNFGKRNRLPICIIAVNLIILFGGALVFSRYANNSSDIIKNVANAGAASFASMLDEQLKSSLFSEQKYLLNVANQIEMNEMTHTQALTNLSFVSNATDEIIMVNSNTLESKTIIKDTDTNKKIQQDYELTEYEKELVQSIDIQKYDEKVLNISKEQWNDEKQLYEIMIYCPVEIDKEEYILLYYKSIADLIKENYTRNNLLLIDNCSIINTNGDLIFGNSREVTIEDKEFNLKDVIKVISSGKDETNYEEKHDTETVYVQERVNLFEYFETHGDEEADAFRKKIDSRENGYMLVQENERQYIYTYYFLEVFPEWVLLNRVERDLINQERDNIKTVLSAIALVLCFLGMNMAIIFWQNIRLKRMLVLQEKNNEELERANKAQQVFISSMSHEIRTPINAVLGMDEMIIRETSEEEIKQYAYDIKNAGKSLLGIVNDILDFTKIQSGKMDIIPQDYELASLINDLLNLVETRAKDKNLEVILDLNQEIPHLMQGDDIRIKQIILNILTNAVKYTEKGNITFKLDYEKKDDSNVILKVSVKDTGIGMKAEEMDKLFKPFERLDEKRNRTIEGTGLGMSIVTNLLTQMGSKLEVSSVYGEGSTFSFELVQPVVDWKGIGPFDRHFRDSKEEKENEGILHARRAKVLVVDDTAVNLTVVTGLLKRTGVQVDTAESGFACLDMCKEKKYDVIFLDHRMPEMDGVETLHRLKSEEGINKETPTIALTANAISGAYEEYIKEGFQDFLSKPVNGNKLERMILKYLPEELLDTEDELEVDDREGMKACGSPDTMNQVRKEFLQTADKSRKELATYLENGDIKNYTIKVHALKSSARLVGAMKLSEEALYLEQCGNDGKVEEILAKTSDFLKHHEKICEIIKSFNPENMDSEFLETIDENTLKEGLEAILEFNEAFDYDQVDSVIAEFDKYEMPDDFKEQYNELKTAIYDVDKDRIEKIILERLGSHGK